MASSILGAGDSVQRAYANGCLEAAKNGHVNGYSAGKANGYSSQEVKQKYGQQPFEKAPFIAACLTHFGFYLLMILGYINQLFFAPKVAKENKPGYPPLYDKFASFYSKYVYRRVRDCWNKPICSVPGAEVVLKDRITKDNGWTFEFTGTETKCLNLSSYNYLGFAATDGPCADSALEAIQKYGVGLASPRHQFGTTPLHVELEALTARFLGVEDAITFGMGFATNSQNIPALVSTGCLVLSDEKNHASLIFGLRLSGATVRVFRHDDMAHLESVLQKAIIAGQPKSSPRQDWKKIVIVVEGIYSMEGTIVNLPKIIEIKKRHKAYLYLDEAHSIGALGKRGRGVVDYYNCDPKDVDIFMGTFTKSFGSAGGYIAGSKELVDYLRVHSFANCHANAMSPPLAAQILSSMKIIMGLDGTGEGQRRIKQLANNTRYFRARLKQMGFIVYGHDDSPVVPILVYLFSKIGAVVRTLVERKIATVGVGFPATPLMENRIRICLSAAHTKEQLDYALEVFDEIASSYGLRYSRQTRDPNRIEYDRGDV